MRNEDFIVLREVRKKMGIREIQARKGKPILGKARAVKTPHSAATPASMSLLFRPTS